MKASFSFLLTALCLCGCHHVPPTTMVASAHVVRSTTPAQLKEADGILKSLRPGNRLQPEQLETMTRYETGDVALRKKYAEILQKAYNANDMDKANSLNMAKNMMRTDGELYAMWQKTVQEMESTK